MAAHKKSVLVNGGYFSSSTDAAEYMHIRQQDLSKALNKGQTIYTTHKGHNVYTIAWTQARPDDEPEPLEQIDDFEPRACCPRVDAVLHRHDKTRYGGLLGRVEISV